MNAIETVANSSEVSKTVFKALSDKQRARRATDLTNLFRSIHKSNPAIEEKEVLAVFKQLQTAKIGSLVIGRRSNHNRFVWNYNLKDVAQAAKGKAVTLTSINAAIPSKKTKVIIRRRRKVAPQAVKMEAPTSEVTTSSAPAKGPRLQLNLELSPNVSMKDVEALLTLAQELQAK